MSIAARRIGDVVLKLDNISLSFGGVKALADVSFSIREGELFSIIGPNGAGKTSIVNCISGRYRPTEGKILVHGRDITDLDREQMLPYRRQMQMIYQDPYASLNPRMSAGEIVGEPLAIHRVDGPKERRERVAALFERVGLRPELTSAFPHEFSGGQRQRIGIARALALNPELIVGDEPVSALDVSIQAQIINLLEDLQREFGLTYLFVAHDLSVVRHISDRVAVMYLGKLVELADRKALYDDPLHPYTRALLSAVPIPDPELESRREHIVLGGEVPSPLNPPAGCVFHPRCPIAIDRCRAAVPELREIRPGHWAACILA